MEKLWLGRSRKTAQVFSGEFLIAQPSERLIISMTYSFGIGLIEFQKGDDGEIMVG